MCHITPPHPLESPAVHRSVCKESGVSVVRTCRKGRWVGNHMIQWGYQEEEEEEEEEEGKEEEEEEEAQTTPCRTPHRHGPSALCVKRGPSSIQRSSRRKWLGLDLQVKKTHTPEPRPRLMPVTVRFVS